MSGLAWEALYWMDSSPQYEKFYLLCSTEERNSSHNVLQQKCEMSSSPPLPFFNKLKKCHPYFLSPFKWI